MTIPIPSFSTTTIDETMEEENNDKKDCILDSGETKDEEMEIVQEEEERPNNQSKLDSSINAGDDTVSSNGGMAILEKQWLLQLEGAVQVYTSSSVPSPQKISNIPSTKKISYDEFCALVRKIDLSPRSSGKQYQNQTQNPEDESFDWTMEERLFHDLYCIAVPNLYRIIKKERQEYHGDRASTNGTIVTLELVHSTENRMKELRRLLNEYEEEMSISSIDAKRIHNAKSKQAMELLQSLRRHRCSDEEGGGTSQPHGSSKSAATVSVLETKRSRQDDVVKPGMSLEERVRARAKKRETTLQKIEDAKKESIEDRLSLADTLFSHARQILRRQHKPNFTFQSELLDDKTSSGTNATTRCVLTFQDVVRVVPQLTRRQVSDLFHTIAQVTPGWISWIDPKQQVGANNNSPIQNGEVCGVISKHATVWIETSDYKSIRARLAGNSQEAQQQQATQPLQPESSLETRTTSQPLNPQAPSDASIVDKPPSQPCQEATESKATAATISAGGMKRNSENLDDSKPIPRRKKKRTLKSLAATAERTSETARASRKSNPIKRPTNNRSTVPQATKQSSSQHDDDEDNLEDSDDVYSSLTASTKKKRQLDELSASPPPSPKSANTKKRRGLRMNTHLILCDADYDGGIVIQPSFESTPRDLKQLFIRMNAGQRI